MPYLSEKFFQAKNLRSKGYSLKEISEKLKISKSTASIWLSDFQLPPLALARLEKRKLMGRVKSSETKKRKRVEQEKLLTREASSFIDSVRITKDHLRIFCAFLYWCEGTKNSSRLTFTNSDPALVKTFLTFLRSCFNIEEKRLRVVLHLHEYHFHKKQISFWSKVTKIPVSQFTKPYDKPHTGKRIKDNYQGCASVRYCDSLLVKKISILAQELLKRYGAVG